jgi:hypothetical protein
VRLRAKTDENQADIVEALRKRGFQVVLMHSVGRGFPDTIVAKDRKMKLVEIKAQKGRLTDSQTVFHSNWVGPCIEIIRSVEEALRFQL